MRSCLSCSYVPELQKEGKLLLYQQGKMIPYTLAEQLRKSYKVGEEDHLLKVTYQSFNELEEIIDFICDFSKDSQKQLTLYGSWKSLEEDQNHAFPKMTPFYELVERIKNRTLLKVINENLFTQHVQPIVSLGAGVKIFGYEFLTRPLEDQFDFSPAQLFAFSQKAGLQSLLDSQARINSIELSAKIIPRGIKRFINFLPSSIYDPYHCLKSTFQAAAKAQVDPQDLVFEVVETEKIQDIDHLKDIFKVYQQQGIEVALDDLGSGYSTPEVLAKLKPNYAKIDRRIIDYCDLDKSKQNQLVDIQKLANEYKIKLLAEGIERKEEIDYCRNIGIDFAQGYFIGKPSPKPVKL